MKPSFLRATQWFFVIAFVAAIAGLTYDFDSEAGKTMNAPTTDRTTQSLLGYWKMDEGTGTSTTADSSGNTNTLTMTAMEEGDWVAGTIGASSLDFDGSAEWLTVADPASGVLDIVDGADFSIVGWFNRDTFAGDDTLVAKKNDQSTNQGYVVWVDNGASYDYLTFQISDGTDTYTATGATDISATGWHHFAAVWNDGTGMYVYLDGRLDGSTTTSTSSVNSLANALDFRIGTESDNGAPFDGKIDDVKLYSKALSTNDVLKLYQTTVPVTPASTAGLGNGLVGHWTFDGPDVIWGDTANEIKDVSGKGNHGAVSGLTASSAVIGKLGQGLQFNGTDDFVSTPNTDTLTSYTFAFWFKTGDVHTDDYNTIVKKGFYDGCKIYQDYLACSTNGFVINDLLLSSSTIVDNLWRFGVFTVTNNSQKLYVNGVLSASRTDSYTSVTNELYIGTATSGDPDSCFPGQIDDVRIYNRVLSPTEVTDLYNTGK